MSPTPLPHDQILQDRFVIQSVLGRGGFGIAYLAFDEIRGDRVVVKELAPDGSQRSGALLDLQTGAMSPQVLRNRFLEEARTLGKLNVQGVLPVRSSFQENGTAYFVTSYQEGSETLDARISRFGALAADEVMRHLFKLLDILEPIHEAGILHRDIKPSNILVTPAEDLFLIDFGSAREYLHDAAQTQTVVYTPGYAPPEQLSERARRGPATDLFALAATAYEMLTGSPPEDVAQRISGALLTSLSIRLPNINPTLSGAIERALSLPYSERPQSAAEMRDQLQLLPIEVAAYDLAEVDELLFRASHFHFNKRACPNCQGLLEEPKPLRKSACPVCRKGRVRMRAIPDNVCPVCKETLLKVRDNVEHLTICPICSKGVLTHSRPGLISRISAAHCPQCESDFEIKNGMVTHSGTTRSVSDWAALGRRSDHVVVCYGCGANFDIMPDHRHAQIHPQPGKYHVLYPDEWARVAAGFAPSVGNAQCDTCEADYFLEEGWLTLLDAREDPYGFAAEYLGRLLSEEDSRWIGVNKQSPNPGLVCDSCSTEMDFDGVYLRLVHSPNRQLGRLVGHPMSMEDLQRVAVGLPTVGKESELEELLDRLIMDGYVTGAVGFSDPSVAWSGQAVRVSDSTRGNFLLNDRELTFGGMLKKFRVPADSIVRAYAEEDSIWIWLSGEREPIEFSLAPQEIVLALKSGSRRLELNAEDLALRIK